MQDRFKFRAFCYGNFIYRDFSKEYSVYNDKGFPVGNVPNDIEWEQCIGLKDRNGRLIYEGDIVRRYVGLGKHGSQKTEDIDVVKWYINGYVLENYCDYFADTDDFEVIGNIHENGDLLNED